MPMRRLQALLLMAFTVERTPENHARRLRFLLRARMRLREPLLLLGEPDTCTLEYTRRNGEGNFSATFPGVVRLCVVV